MIIFPGLEKSGIIERIFPDLPVKVSGKKSGGKILIKRIFPRIRILKTLIDQTGLRKRASAIRIPSAAEEVIPPAIPAPSPAV